MGDVAARLLCVFALDRCELGWPSEMLEGLETLRQTKPWLL